MTTLTLDLEQFTAALSKTSNKMLEWVWLNPNSPIEDETAPPSYAPSVPSVMADFVMVSSSNYRFAYSGFRYGKFSYLIERDGRYEAGELSVLHDLVVTVPGDELSPPASSSFVPPTITTCQTVAIGSIESLGVLFSFIHDSTTDGAQPKFGLAYKITDANPSVFPRITMSFVTLLLPETNT